MPILSSDPVDSALDAALVAVVEQFHRAPRADVTAPWRYERRRAASRRLEARVARQLGELRDVDRQNLVLGELPVDVRRAIQDTEYDT